MPALRTAGGSARTAKGGQSFRGSNDAALCHDGCRQRPKSGPWVGRGGTDPAGKSILFGAGHREADTHPSSEVSHVMRHQKMFHLLVLAGWGALTVVGCSVKSDGLGSIEAGAPSPGAGGHGLLGGPGSGGGPMPSGGAGLPPARSGSGGGPSTGGTGGAQPGAGSGGADVAPAGTGGEGVGGNGVGTGAGGEVGSGAGTAGRDGSLPPAGSGGMKVAGTGGEGTGGKRDAGGTGGGSGGQAAGSGGSGGTPDCSGMPKPPVAPSACSKGAPVLACAESATDPGQWGWVVICPGQDPSQADAGATDARPGNDGGTAGGPADVCAASFDCPTNQVCTTQDGVCNPPPGCPSMGGRACSGGCYGTCRDRMLPPPSGGGCRSDGDCRIQADACMTCSCIGLGQNDMPPSCQGQGQGQGPGQGQGQGPGQGQGQGQGRGPGQGQGQGSRCFQDPCSGQHARCQQGSCVASPS